MDKKIFSKTNLRSKNHSKQFGPENCKNFKESSIDFTKNIDIKSNDGIIIKSSIKITGRNTNTELENNYLYLSEGDLKDNFVDEKKLLSERDNLLLTIKEQKEIEEKLLNELKKYINDSDKNNLNLFEEFNKCNKLNELNKNNDIKLKDNIALLDEINNKYIYLSNNLDNYIKFMEDENNEIEQKLITDYLKQNSYIKDNYNELLIKNENLEEENKLNENKYNDIENFTKSLKEQYNNYINENQKVCEIYKKNDENRLYILRESFKYHPYFKRYLILRNNNSNEKLNYTINNCRKNIILNKIESLKFNQIISTINNPYILNKENEEGFIYNEFLNLFETYLNYFFEKEKIFYVFYISDQFSNKNVNYIILNFIQEMIKIDNTNFSIQAYQKNGTKININNIESDILIKEEITKIQEEIIALNYIICKNNNNKEFIYQFINLSIENEDVENILNKIDEYYQKIKKNNYNFKKKNKKNIFQGNNFILNDFYNDFPNQTVIIYDINDKSLFNKKYCNILMPLNNSN
jgi:hypothetical protein